MDLSANSVAEIPLSVYKIKSTDGGLTLIRAVKIAYRAL